MIKNLLIVIIFKINTYNIKIKIERDESSLIIENYSTNFESINNLSFTIKLGLLREFVLISCVLQHFYSIYEISHFLLLYKQLSIL